MKSKITGGILATIGYLLSPLSWWNDLLINIPIAYGFGFLFGLFSKNLFLPAMIFGYWLTNIAGFILMHHGAKKIVSTQQNKYTKSDFFKDTIISIFYTIIVLALVKIGWLKFPLEYFR